MAEKVMIEVVGQSAGLDELAAKLASATQRQKELLDQADALQKQKQQWDGVAQKVSEYDKKIQEVNTEIKSNRKSIDDFIKALKAMPGAIIAEDMNKSLKAQRAELVKQLGNWSDWSDAGKKAYKETLAQAGELDDKIKDLTGQIRFMGSDTAAFDAILQGTQLVAGGFAVAQGAAALFGAENDDLQKLMVKLQSVMAITVGLQQVGNALQKDSNLMTGISVIQTKAKTAAQAMATKGTIAATVAQKALNVVANANPYILLATALISVVGAIYFFTKGADEASESNKKFKSTTDDMKFATAEARDEHDKFNQSIRDIQVDIDVARGKVSSYGAEIIKLKNDLADSLAEIDKDTEKKLIDISNKYDGFWNRLKGTFANFVQGVDLYTAWELTYKEQNKKMEDVQVENNIKTIQEIQKANAKQMAENEKRNDEIIKQNEDLHAKNLSGLQGNLEEIRLARKRDLDAARTENAERLKEGQKVLIDESAINKKYDNQESEARKSAAEKAKSEQDKINADTKKMYQNLQDAKIASLKDGEDKEISQLRASLSKRLDEIKGNSKTEIELRKQLTENEGQEEEKIRIKYQNERANLELETQMNLINARLNSAEKGSIEERDIRIEAAKKQSEIDMETANQSVNTAEWKAAKIKEIETKLQADIKSINQEYIKTAEERAAAEVLAYSQQYANGIISRNDYEDKIKSIRKNALQDEINERIAAGQNVTDLLQKQADENIAISQEEADKKKQIIEDLVSESLNTLSSIGDSLFTMQKNRLDAQAEEVTHYYDNEIKMAEGNATKQKQLEEQKAAKLLEIKRKQAQAEKNQAIFNATIQLAEGIIRIWSQSGINIPLAIITSAMLAATTAIQIAAINSQPLPKYAKGRKGGKGEFAQLHKDEIMWVPEDASIMPAMDSRQALRGNQKMFDKWDMPRIEPAFVSPRINRQLIAQFNRQHPSGEKIDYEKLGKAVAKNIKFPKIQQRDVSVTFDKTGLAVTDGNTTTHYLNTKYKI